MRLLKEVPYHRTQNAACESSGKSGRRRLGRALLQIGEETYLADQSIGQRNALGLKGFIHIHIYIVDFGLCPYLLFAISSSKFIMDSQSLFLNC